MINRISVCGLLPAAEIMKGIRRDLRAKLQTLHSRSQNAVGQTNALRGRFPGPVPHPRSRLGHRRSNPRLSTGCESPHRTPIPIRLRPFRQLCVRPSALITKACQPKFSAPNTSWPSPPAWGGRKILPASSKCSSRPTSTKPAWKTSSKGIT
jgi:hypothetical protein